jgi:hypothetical protein
MELTAVERKTILGVLSAAPLGSRKDALLDHVRTLLGRPYEPLTFVDHGDDLWTIEGRTVVCTLRGIRPAYEAARAWELGYPPPSLADLSVSARGLLRHQIRARRDGLRGWALRRGLHRFAELLEHIRVRDTIELVGYAGEIMTLPDL